VKPHHETPPRPNASPEPLKAATQPAPLAQVKRRGVAMEKWPGFTIEKWGNPPNMLEKMVEFTISEVFVGMNERLE